METTFFLPHTSAATARSLFGDWRCRVEQMERGKSCNVVFFSQKEWQRFEEYAEEHSIEYSLV